MGASDYMTGNAPAGASFQMGNFAKQLFDMIGGLPQDYYQGQQSQFQQGQNQRTVEQQNLFRDGIPVGPNGQPDYSAMIAKMIQTGGAPAAAPLMHTLLGAQIGSNAADAITAGDGTQAPREPITAPVAQTAAMLDRGGRAGQPVSPAPSAGAGGGAPSTRSTPVGTEAEARQRLDRAQNKEALAAKYAGVGQKDVKDALLQSAKDDRERAKQIFEALGTYNKPTDKERDVASGTDAKAAQTAADIKYYDTIHRGRTGAADIMAQQKQNIDILRQVAEAPSLTLGPGSNLWLQVQRMAATAGINPTSAAPAEIFHQVAAKILADQFAGLKSLATETGEQGGRIFKPMLDIEEKANITPEDSLEGVKAKLKIFDEMGNLMIRWGNKADQYKIDHGRLDAKFERDLRAEIANARIPDVVPKPKPESPPMQGARKAPDGKWYVADPSRPGKYLMVQ